MGNGFKIKKLRNDNIVVSERKEKNMRDLLKITRSLNEQREDITTQTGENLATPQDQENETKKIQQFFDDMTVNLEMGDLKVHPDLVHWGGLVDGSIEFTYSVTPEDDDKGVQITYPNDFDSNIPENQEIIERLQEYYKTFYKYWRDNMIKK